MKNIIAIMVLSLSVLGCQSIETIKENYAKVNFYDGISQEDAILIAQRGLLTSIYFSNFDVMLPQVEGSDASAEYPNMWFVSFPLKDKSRAVRHLYLIDKRTGGIIRDVHWDTINQQEFSWIFTYGE